MACKVCGCKSTVGNGVCKFLCNWILEGWIGWNARDGKVVVLTATAMKVATANGHKRLSYPKMVALARSLGWTGCENPITTFE